jgi:hypothetical protein
VQRTGILKINRLYFGAMHLLPAFQPINYKYQQCAALKIDLKLHFGQQDSSQTSRTAIFLTGLAFYLT